MNVLADFIAPFSRWRGVLATASGGPGHPSSVGILAVALAKKNWYRNYSYTFALSSLSAVVTAQRINACNCGPLYSLQPEINYLCFLSALFLSLTLVTVDVGRHPALRISASVTAKHVGSASYSPVVDSRLRPGPALPPAESLRIDVLLASSLPGYSWANMTSSKNRNYATLPDASGGE